MDLAERDANDDFGYIVRTRDGYNAPKPPPVRPPNWSSPSRTRAGVLDLGPNDPTVFEDGIEQKVDAFHEVVAPASIVLALDSSGSMKKSALVNGRRTRVWEVLRPEDSLGLLEFADQADLVHDLHHGTGRDPEDHRSIHSGRRHGAVRRALRCAHPVDPRRRPPCDRAGY